MIEIFSNLFVGSQSDEATIRDKTGWFVVHACKEPYHRQALGYTGRAAAKDHPEYLIARREGRLILNLVDVDDVAYVSSQIVDAALEAIQENIAIRKVLLHCNQGLSRSPSIGFLYLARYSEVFDGLDFESASERFARTYPPYAPAKGMADYVRLNWRKNTAPLAPG
jgi:hypothetical protein